MSRNLGRLKEYAGLVGDSWTYYEDWLKGRDPSTQEGYLRAFLGFLKWMSLDTEGLYSLYLDLVKDPDPRRKKKIGMLVINYQKHLMEGGMKGGSTRNVYVAVKGFFDANELPFEINGERVRDDSEEIPNISRHQIMKVLDATGSYKTKAFILFARDSGLRVGDITNLPIRVVKKPLEDTDIEFYTFEWKQQKTGRYANPVLGPKSLEALRVWMYHRINVQGISAKDDDPLFCVEKTREEYTTKSGKVVKGIVKGDWMDESNMGVVFSQLVRKAKLEPLPGEKKVPSIHSLRKFHKTTLEYAGVPTSWINKMQGRKGEGTGGIYTKPSPDMFIEMYSKGYPTLNGPVLEEGDVENLNQRIDELTRITMEQKQTIELMTPAFRMAQRMFDREMKLDRLMEPSKEP